MEYSYVKINRNLITQFSKDLSTLQDAGLAPLRSLRILEENQKDKNFKEIIGLIADDLEAGSTFSKALAKFPYCFDELFINIITAGEIGGILDVSLARLGDLREKEDLLHSRVYGFAFKSAKFFFISIIFFIAMLAYFLSKFSLVLKEISSKVNLPQLTTLLIDISNWLMANHCLNLLVLICLPIALFFIFKFLRTFYSFKYLCDVISLKYIPGISKIVYFNAVARWTQSLAILIYSGVPILEAIQTTAKTCNNLVFVKALWNVHTAIRQGDTFSNPLKQSNTVDSFVYNTIDVGEETGDLDKMLGLIANSYGEKAEMQVKFLTNSFGPLLVLTFAFMLGIALLGLFLPLFEAVKTLVLV